MTVEHSQLERLGISSRNKFRALLDGMVDEVMSIDSDFRILMSNEPLARSVKASPQEVVGQICHKLIYGFDRPCPEQGMPCPYKIGGRYGKLH